MTFWTTFVIGRGPLICLPGGLNLISNKCWMKSLYRYLEVLSELYLVQRVALVVVLLRQAVARISADE